VRGSTREVVVLLAVVEKVAVAVVEVSPLVIVALVTVQAG
jgi:hypothetical protein